MKKIYFFLSGIFLISGITLQAQVLTVPSVMQQESEWCWSACSDCILQYFNDNNTQCTIAEYARTQQPSTFGSVNCCTDPSGNCNTPNFMWGITGSIQDILHHFKRINSSGISSALDTAQFRSQMHNRTPFVMRWGWNSGGGHFLVDYGLIDSSVYYMDPLNGYQIADYSWVVYNVIHTWTSTLVLDTIVNGINSINESTGSIAVYPNPSTGVFTLTCHCGQSGESPIIRVYNLVGEQVLTQTLRSVQGDNTIDISNQPDGVYLYRVVSESGNLLGKGKLVIQK
jgi:hypothetical protein